MGTKAALPNNEADRIQSLHSTQILDSLPEQAYDDITRLAAQIAGTPIAVVTLVDTNRQWFKSKVGLEVCSTPRDVAFCAHAILEPGDLMVVPDAEQDTRFADNPLVTAEPRIRFYAGAPLVLSNGHALGTLCVIDRRPRMLTPAQRESLRVLSRHVVALLELRAALGMLKDESQARLAAQEGLRQANRLLSRLNQVQLDFIRDVAPDVLFNNMLDLVIEASGSDYAFIGEAIRDSHGLPYLKIYAITNIAWNEASRALYEAQGGNAMEFRNRNTLVGRVMVEERTLISNAPATDPRAGGLPQGHPPLSAFMGVPLIDKSELIGMVGLANRPDGYDEGMADCLQPYLTTCTYLIAGYRNRRLRAEAEHALRESEQRLELAMKGADLGLWDWNLRTGEVYFDDRWIAMLGYARDELDPHVQTWEQLVHPDDMPYVQEVLTDHIEGRTPLYETEHRVRTRTGQWKWILNRGRVVERDAEGHPLRAVGTHLDITARREAEDALHAAKEYAENIIESSPDMIIAVDGERRIVEFNRAAEAAFGYSREEVLGAHVDLVYADADQSGHVHATTLSGGFSGEVLNRRRLGQVFPAFLATTALRDSSGRVVGAVGISRDISARKRAEAKLGEMYMELEKSHGDLLAILNQLRLGIVTIDGEGRVTFVSRSWQQWMGEGAGNRVGLPWEDACPFIEGDRKKLRAAFAGRSRGKIPVELAAPDGRHLHLEVEVQDDPRNPRGKILFIYDVTEILDLRRQLEGKARFRDLIGKSEPMRHVYDQILDLSKVDATVLIEGETGTGKELVARAVHDSSKRTAGPFIAVNCAGLSESLVAGQLFGHKRGAFTGAVQDQPGFFEAADGGTLFLDEIGDVPLTVQTNLLRVLQEREVTRIGESRPRRVDVRIIAATNRDLSAEVARGTFRQDLFYRIRVASIHLPPLRQRREDIPLLVRAFLDRFQRAASKTIDEIDAEAMRLLTAHDWPGNVRELQNAIESAVVKSRGAVLLPDSLPPDVLGAKPKADVSQPWVRVPRSMKRQQLLDALQQTRGNRAAAAKFLGIGRSTLYRQLEEFGLLEPE